MPNKDFKEQKNFIAIKLNDALSAMLELKPNLASNIVAGQIKAINELQPPKPPTCSTCDHINLKCDSSAYNGFLCKNINALNADGDVVSTSGGYNIRIKNIDNFGCIHHSDYGDAK